MKLKSYLSTLILIIGCSLGSSVFMTSCWDGLDFSNGINEVPEGYLLINLAVPSPTVVETRSGIDESAVNSLHLFIYSQDENDFLQHQEINISNISNNQVSVPLNTKARNQQTSIYAVANVNLSDREIGDFETVTNLKEFLLENMNSSNEIDLSYGIPMIGNNKVNTGSARIANISLLRDIAKITTSVTAENYSLVEYQIYNFAPKTYLSSAIDNGFKYLKTESKIQKGLIVDENKDFSEYLYPTEGMTEKGDSEGSYIVVKVNKTTIENETEKNKDLFYRLNLRIGDEVKDGNLTYVNFEPNHWYKVKITGFMTDGYDSYEEAAKHPETDQYVAYEIHDHAAEVLSMVTDGYNELGVSPEVVLRPRTLDAEGNITGRDGTIIVKCYSPDGPVEINDFEVLLNGHSEWLELGERKIHNSEDDPHPDYDKDDQKGQQYEIPVSIITGKNIYEDSSWDILVKWKGLERTVKISYEAAFLLPQVCEASLIIKNGDDNLKEFSTIKDYWTFITGSGKLYGEPNGSATGESSTPHLFGILSKNMTGGKKRTNGFHFPMPYGKSYKTTPWEYEYEVDFSKMLNLPEYSGHSSITAVAHRISGDLFFNNSLSWNYNSSTKKGTLKFIGNKNSYEYAGGNIIFDVTFDNGDTAQVTASLYHTGFFHFEKNTAYVPKNYRGYYYYEVVEMAGGHWLDRNVGATANTSFIDIETEMTEEERAAAGRLYSIIKETKPFKLADINLEMCPPGYHIPTQTEWDGLRLSNNFKTKSTIIDQTVYMTTYYETGVSKIGNIYLQKARFYYGVNAYLDNTRYSDEPNEGDAGAAYYWTITEAPAMEKEQMGNWVRALYLNGSSSTYVNASLTDHRMPIRCKAGNKEDALNSSESYISFNVHNATHAYIFNKGTHAALYSFPGKEIGSITSAEKWQHFYTSTTQKLDDLLVLFVKIDNNGAVHVIRKAQHGTKNEDGEDIYFEIKKDYSESLLNETYAWKIEQGRYYDFCETAQKRVDFISDNKPTTSEDSDHPQCNVEPDSSSEGGGGQEEIFPELNVNDYQFTSQNVKKDGYGDEITISTTKQYFKNYDGSYQGLCYGGYNWSKVQPGSILRIYTHKVDDRYTLQIFHGSWGNPLFNITNPTYTYNPGNGRTEESVIEIELTQSLLTTIINNQGLCFQGKCCILLGITIQQPMVELPSGDYLYQGRLTMNWSNFNELSSESYDWSKVKEGAKLTIEFDYTDYNSCQVQIKNGNGGVIPGIPDVIASWSNSQYMTTKSFNCTLTTDMLNNIKQNGGLVLGGGNYYLTKLELRML